MEINKKSRTELKAYFVKNALPTAGNFSDLIDAALNQKDDGLVKSADQPVQIAASTAGDKPAIHLYESFATDTKPAWVLGLQVDGKKGLGIGDGDGKNRLFVDGATGNVGIGTTTPKGKQHIVGDLVLGVDANNAKFIFHSRSNTSGDFLQITSDNSSGAWNWDQGGITLRRGGNVGIGTADPGSYKLNVAGNVNVTGTLRSPMWNVTQVLKQKRGPMPVSGTFQSSGGTLLVFASGSGIQQGTAAVIGMAIKLDNTQVGSANAWSNVQSAHQRFVPEALVLQGIAAGSHTIALSSLSGTVSDDNDYFSVTVLELPF